MGIKKKPPPPPIMEPHNPMMKPIRGNQRYIYSNEE
jgi:hypothetical protein